jgi:hypothetical protein
MCEMMKSEKSLHGELGPGSRDHESSIYQPAFSHETRLTTSSTSCNTGDLRSSLARVAYVKMHGDLESLLQASHSFMPRNFPSCLHSYVPPFAQVFVAVNVSAPRIKGLTRLQRVEPPPVWPLSSIGRSHSAPKPSYIQYGRQKEITNDPRRHR